MNTIALLESKIKELTSRIQTAIIMMLIILAVEFMAFLSGFSFAYDKANQMMIVIHAIGCTVTAFFVLDSWHYKTSWYLFSFFGYDDVILIS
jgi:hypothetical protein